MQFILNRTLRTVSSSTKPVNRAQATEARKVRCTLLYEYVHIKSFLREDKLNFGQLSSFTRFQATGAIFRKH